MQTRPLNRKKKKKSISIKDIKEFCLNNNREKYCIQDGRQATRYSNMQRTSQRLDSLISKSSQFDQRTSAVTTYQSNNVLAKHVLPVLGQERQGILNMRSMKLNQTPKSKMLPPLRKDMLSLYSPQHKPRNNDNLKEAMNLELKNTAAVMPILKPKHILQEFDVNNPRSISPNLKGVDYLSCKHASNISINKRASNISTAELRSFNNCSNVNWNQTYWSKNLSPVSNGFATNIHNSRETSPVCNIQSTQKATDGFNSVHRVKGTDPLQQDPLRFVNCSEDPSKEEFDKSLSGQYNFPSPTIKELKRDLQQQKLQMNDISVTQNMTSQDTKSLLDSSIDEIFLYSNKKRLNNKVKNHVINEYWKRSNDSVMKRKENRSVQRSRENASIQKMKTNPVDSTFTATGYEETFLQFKQVVGSCTRSRDFTKEYLLGSGLKKSTFGQSNIKEYSGKSQRKSVKVLSHNLSSVKKGTQRLITEENLMNEIGDCDTEYEKEYQYKKRQPNLAIELSQSIEKQQSGMFSPQKIKSGKNDIKSPFSSASKGSQKLYFGQSGSISSKNQRYTRYLSQFKNTLVVKRENLKKDGSITNYIQEQNTNIEDQECADQNLETLIINDEYFEELEQAKEKVEIDKIKVKTTEMIDNLKQKSDVAREVQLKELKGLRAVNFAKFFVGTKADFLVSKYLTTIKEKVQEQQDQAYNKEKNKMVTQIVKKLKFNQTMKNTVVDPNKSKNQSNQESKSKIDSAAITLQSDAKEIKELKPKATASSTLNRNMETRGNKEDVDLQGVNSPETQVRGSEKAAKDDDMQQLKSQMLDGNMMNEYVSKSIAKGSQPLPILNRITPEKEMMLLNYKMNQSNSESFGDALKSLIPQKLIKLTLYDNNLNDRTIASIFNSLSQIQNGGLQTFSLIQNQIGNETINSLADKYFESDSVTHIKKFYLKNPIIVSKQFQMDRVFQKIQDNSLKLKNLSTLQISQMKLSPECMQPLGESIKGLMALKFLDLSATNLNGNNIHELLSIIDRFNFLRSIDLSYNSVKQLGNSEKSENWVMKTLSNFIHFSDSLLHIDLGGMNMSQKELEYIFRNGLRKSRTLISCHFVGANNYGEEKYQELLQILKIKPKSKFDPILDTEAYDQIFLKQKMVNNAKDQFADEITKQANKQRNTVKKLQNAPLFQVEPKHKLVFERILGHPEILGSHKWMDSKNEQCKICNKLCYCVFIWNYEVQNDDAKRYKFYKQSLGKPIVFQKQYENTNFPVLSVNKKLHKMVQLGEYLERLDHSKYSGSLNFRNCESIIEQKKHQELKNKVLEYVHEEKQIHPTFINQINQAIYDIPTLTEKEKNQLYRDKIVPEDLTKMQNWADRIVKLIPPGAFIPVDIKEYCEQIQQKYEQLYQYARGSKKKPNKEEQDIDNFRVDMLRLEAISKETFLASAYLPCHYDLNNTQTVSGLKAEVMVCHPQMQNVDLIGIINIPKQPNNKHLSIHTMKIKYKELKKVKQIRLFVFKKSVFANWKRDDDKMLDKAFSLDAQYLKCFKFIKDKDELNKVIQVLKRHFSFLKEQFLSQICDQKFYPVITWMEFSHACDQWSIIDENLTTQDMDRTFVATNYEEVDLDDNDDNSLCRYELLEIVVRMAKIKFHEKGICPSIAEATEKLLVEHIIPNSITHMPWQQFREERLWNLECDDLFKANMQQMKELYRFAKGITDANPNQLDMHDCIGLFDQAGFQGVDNEKFVAIAFVLSKMTIIDEMEDFSNYEDMLFVEFIEFLSRMAEQLIKIDQPLHFKLEYLLSILFQKLIKQKLIKPTFADAQDSDSDYADDLVDEIKEQYL